MKILFLPCCKHDSFYGELIWHAVCDALVDFVINKTGDYANIASGVNLSSTFAQLMEEDYVITCEAQTQFESFNQITPPKSSDN